MIKITCGHLRSDPFQVSISKIVNASGLEAKVAYNVMRLAKELEKNMVELQKEWVALLGKYVQKDGTKWKLNEEKTDFMFIEGVDVEEAKTVVKAYLAREIEIDREPLKLEDLSAAKISPADISVLEPILTLPEL